MDLKVVAVLCCLSALTISSGEAGIPKCCISVRKSISPRILMKTVRWRVQKSGACDIDAAVLYFSNQRRPACVDLAVFENLVFRREEWRTRKQKENVHTRPAKFNI